MWTRARDEPDVKSGEVLQAAVQTISSQAKAGYSNSQQKGTLRATPKRTTERANVDLTVFLRPKKSKRRGDNFAGFYTRFKKHSRTM